MCTRGGGSARCGELGRVGSGGRTTPASAFSLCPVLHRFPSEGRQSKYQTGERESGANRCAWHSSSWLQTDTARYFRILPNLPALGTKGWRGTSGTPREGGDKVERGEQKHRLCSSTATGSRETLRRQEGLSWSNLCTNKPLPRVFNFPFTLFTFYREREKKLKI